MSSTLKEGCYKDINLSNEDTAEKLYPDVSDNLYEMLIGFKPGNYMCQVYFPAGIPIYRLDFPDMYPLVGSATLKYLGAIKPSDSPVGNPTFKLYLFYRLTPVILRLMVNEGVAYEKITMEILINRCLMDVSRPAPPNITPKPIFYLDEIKSLTTG